jgi:aromatic ring-cleaving dioxygenase
MGQGGGAGKRLPCRRRPNGSTVEAMSDDHPISAIKHFHAHVYFDGDSRDKALAFREQVGQAFDDVVVGRFHEKAVGPHAYPMFQVAFQTDRFASFVPWLALNRDGLNILVHPATGDSLADHTEHAMWLGTKLPLNEEVLRRPRK